VTVVQLEQQGAFCQKVPQNYFETFYYEIFPSNSKVIFVKKHLPVSTAQPIPFKTPFGEMKKKIQK